MVVNVKVLDNDAVFYPIMNRRPNMMVSGAVIDMVKILSNESWKIGINLTSCCV